MCLLVLFGCEEEKKGENIELRSNNLNISIEKMEAGDYLTQTFAMFVPLGWVDNAFEVTGDLQSAIDGIESGDIIFYKGSNIFF